MYADYLVLLNYGLLATLTLARAKRTWKDSCGTSAHLKSATQPLKIMPSHSG
ncbi:MAG: hypothetical protein ACHQQQ_05490 [Bacteroidota bacterium]